LDKNYRSRPIILSTTDMIFSNYSDRDAISDWCNQYPSQSAKKTELGSSLVFEIDKETTKELGVNQSLATAAAIRAADLHHQAPDKSI
ncbi:MAG: hypothetical protein QGF46_02830, partial [Planctomycetota bacterium]|nr:hypothetical protein [Planctomycetota bacterium]